MEPTTVLYKKLLYYTELRSLGDFLFFIHILLGIINIYNTHFTLKKYIFILNLVCSKYVSIFQGKDLCFFAGYKYSSKEIHEYLELFLEREAPDHVFLEKYKLQQRVILCKKVSRTRRKGRINRYKIIIMLYDDSETWFGIGKAKDFYLYNALSKARLNSLKNIFFPTREYERSKEVTTNIQKGKVMLSFRRVMQNALPSSLPLLRSILSSIRGTNLSITKAGTTNVSKLLKLMLR